MFTRLLIIDIVWATITDIREGKPKRNQAGATTEVRTVIRIGGTASISFDWTGISYCYLQLVTNGEI